METKEIWKDVPGYEGYYQASTLGRVKGLRRVVLFRGSTKILSERILIPNLSINGYYKNTLSINKSKRQIAVHQIIAISFLGHKIDGLNLVINHIDGDRLNNFLSNIEIVTHRVNVTQRFRRDKNRLTSQYAGVNWHKGKKRWEAKIYIDGKQRGLGCFHSEIDASGAYQFALNKLVNQ